MDYLPVPPNCPYFETAFGLPCFKIYGKLIFISLRTRDDVPNGDEDYAVPDSYNRPFISSITEVGWLKECKRIADKYIGPPDVPVKFSDEDAALYAQAFDNSDICRAWGIGV